MAAAPSDLSITEFVADMIAVNARFFPMFSAFTSVLLAVACAVVTPSFERRAMYLAAVPILAPLTYTFARVLRDRTVGWMT